MGIEEARAEDIADLEKDVKPEAVLDRLERAEGAPQASAAPDERLTH